MERLRCHHCNAVFPDSMTACPRCGKDPDPPSTWKTVMWVAGVIAAGLIVVSMVLTR